MQIQLEKTLDVEVVERQLALLWEESAHDPHAETDDAVLRARVANLLVYVSNDGTLGEVHQLLRELTPIHPCRALIMLGAPEATDQDIEMSVETICQTDKRTAVKRLCCEEITLKAKGKFVAELPSAALPLMVPDLSTFLWWRNAPHVSDKLLDILLRATDRLVIDSADFPDPQSDLIETNKLFTAENYDHVGISDLNWARLTFWRELLADFYDVATCRTWLDTIDSVQIDYVAPEQAQKSIAPQALLIAGWLASRLDWTLADEQPLQMNDTATSFKFSASQRSRSATISENAGDREIKLALNRVERDERKPGRLVQVELRSNFEGVGSFRVARSDNNLHLLAEAKLGTHTHRGRVLPVRNRSAAQLLSREMEILCNDQIYQEAVAIAAKMTDRSTTSAG